ncbi:MAG: hypothetical protein IT337_10695 [Thermomicrobiales bacterium]|nr:hypothetical protein [Thermomicrobiales bacterium]
MDANTMDRGGGDDAARFERLRTRRLASGAGIAFAALFLVALLILVRTPGGRPTDQDVIAFYASDRPRWTLLGGIYLLPIAVVAFLWFAVAFRLWVEERDRPMDRLLAGVQALSAAGFITLAFVAASAATAIAAGVELADYPVDAAIARQFSVFSRTLLMIFGMRMAAIFVTSTARLGDGAGILPRWFVVGSYAVAAALFLAATLGAWLVVVFPLWMLVLSGLIWMSGRPSSA